MTAWLLIPYKPACEGTGTSSCCQNCQGTGSCPSSLPYSTCFPGWLVKQEWHQRGKRMIKHDPLQKIQHREIFALGSALKDLHTVCGKGACSAKLSATIPKLPSETSWDCIAAWLLLPCGSLCWPYSLDEYFQIMLQFGLLCVNIFSAAGVVRLESLLVLRGLLEPGRKQQVWMVKWWR